MAKENAEATAGLETAKADLTTAKENYKKFLKSNNLKDGATPKDEVLAKKMANHQAKIEKAEKAVKSAKKALKPKKEKAERVSKYEYPADCTTAEAKKKFRASQRSASNKSEKASKKSAKAEKPAKSEKKKSKKEAVVAED